MKQIPNLITLGNLLCGVLACVCAANGQVDYASALIILGIVFDFFDGLAARILGVSSPMGKELDSLADVVTSGVAPGLIFLSLLSQFGYVGLAFLGLLIPLFSAYRLAKFNLDTRQTHSFIGLPTPANALVWVSVALAVNINSMGIDFSTRPWVIGFAVVSVILNILLVSELPMFALKIKNLSWKDNKVRYIFIIGCVALIAVFRELGLAFSILWYIVLSIITRPKSEEV